MEKADFPSDSKRAAGWTEADMRIVDPSIQNDVHVLILDYLLHNATSALLAMHMERLSTSLFSSNKSPTENTLVHQVQMIDAFLDILKNFEEGLVSGTTSFRLMLLRFLTLYTLRFSGNPLASLAPSSSTIGALRKNNRARACKWLNTIGNGSIDTDITRLLKTRREEDMEDVFAKSEGPSCEKARLDPGPNDRTSGVKLLDLLPSCIELTAARAQLGGFSEPTTIREGHEETVASGSGDINPSHPKKRKRAREPQSTEAEDWIHPTPVDNPPCSQKSHVKKACNGSATPSWGTSISGLKFLLSLMQHASLEPVPQQCPLEQIVEAFSWGPGPWGYQGTSRGGADISNFTDDDVRIHNVFHLGTDLPGIDNGVPGKTDLGNVEYARTYREMRYRYLRGTLKCLRRGSEGEEAYRGIIEDCSLEKLDQDMIEYLNGLHDSIEAPLLVQLENYESTERNGPLIIDGLQLSEDEADGLRAIMILHET